MVLLLHAGFSKLDFILELVVFRCKFDFVIVFAHFNHIITVNSFFT